MDKELRRKGRSLEPIMKVGKNGITDGVLEQLEHELENKKLIKVKLVKGALESLDRKKAAQDLAEKTGSELVDLVGGSIILYKR